LARLIMRNKEEVSMHTKELNVDGKQYAIHGVVDIINSESKH